MLTAAQIEALLDGPVYGIDTLAMLGDIENLLDFAERNIAEQKRVENALVESRYIEDEFDEPALASQLNFQAVAAVEYRFDVLLTQRIQYAAMVGLVTTIEWVVEAFWRRLRAPGPPRPRPCTTSEVIRRLRYLDTTASLGLTATIDDLEVLIHVRNCVVHAAGLIDSYSHATELRSELATYHGIKLTNANFLGEGIEVEAGHLRKVTEEAKVWLPRVEETLHRAGLMT